MNDYQTPLFCCYDIEVEFERRLSFLRTAMRRSRDRLRSISSREREYAFCGSAEISPLEVMIDDAVLREIESEPRRASGSRLFELKVGYCGDDELWSLNPGFDGPFPDGEWFRNHLIVSCLAKSDVQARAILDARLEAILRIVTLQTSKIDEFEDGLAAIVHAYAGRLEHPDLILEFAPVGRSRIISTR